jgi:hypothetical protein
MRFKQKKLHGVAKTRKNQYKCPKYRPNSIKNSGSFILFPVIIAFFKFRINVFSSKIRVKNEKIAGLHLYLAYKKVNGTS